MAGVRRAEVLGSASRFMFPFPDTGITHRLYRLCGSRETPVKILWGKNNGVLPVALSEHWLDALPHAELEVIEDASHMLVYEQPAVVAERIAAMVASA